MSKINSLTLRKSGSIHFREYDSERKIPYDVWVVKLIRVVFIVSKTMAEPLGHVNAFEALVCPLTRKIVKLRPTSSLEGSGEEIAIERRTTYVCSEKYTCLNRECPLVDSENFMANHIRNLGLKSREDFENFIELVKLMNIFIREHYGEIEKEEESIYLLDEVLGEET